MFIVKGNKKKEMSEQEFESLSKNFGSVVLDIGTGDGKFVYKNASKDKNTLFIGIDPVERQLRTFSKKSNRKRLENTLFVLGSADTIPSELFSCIDKIIIILPWGTLLEKVIKGDREFLEDLNRLLKVSGGIEIYLGYSPELEPSETKRLELPPINEDFIHENIVPQYSPYFSLEVLEKMNKKNLDEVGSSWAKKLKHGNDRDIFKMVFRKKA